MRLWPLAEPGTFATQTVIARPRLRIATATLTAYSETPLHEHPHHDQFVHLVRGAATLIFGHGERRTISQNEAVIIPAGLVHSFSSDQETRLITICLGDDGTETYHLAHQPIRAWWHNGLYYLHGSGIRLCVQHVVSATDQYGLFEEKIIVNDIDYIHPSVKDHPVPNIPSPRRSLRERLTGFKIQKRSKVLAATYSRPNGLPSAP